VAAASHTHTTNPHTKSSVPPGYLNEVGHRIRFALAQENTVFMNYRLVCLCGFALPLKCFVSCRLCEKVCVGVFYVCFVCVSACVALCVSVCVCE
jgi:hypothetical protein